MWMSPDKDLPQTGRMVVIITNDGCVLEDFRENDDRWFFSGDDSDGVVFLWTHKPRLPE